MKPATKKYLILTILLLLGFSLVSFAAETEREKLLFSRYRLIGTMVKSNALESVAVIKDTTTKKESIYKMGQILGGFYIVKIKRAEIELLREGKIISMKLPLGGGAEFITVVSDQERIVNRSALNGRYKSLNDCFKAGLALPHVEKGKIKGLKIIKINDKELASLAGVKEGDILLSVNDNKLTGVQGALRLYNDLRVEPELKIKIKRNNTVYKYTYYMNWGAGTVTKKSGKAL